MSSQKAKKVIVETCEDGSVLNNAYQKLFTKESEFELEDKPFFDYQILEVMVFKL